MSIEQVETLVIGAGHAGLAVAQQLASLGRPALVLERGRIGERWRSERWEGMHFQTPNELVRLCDFPFRHGGAQGFATTAEIAHFLDDYAESHALQVRQGVEVARLSQSGAMFRAETSARPVLAANVVVATGPFQRPVIPDFPLADPGIRQLHAAAYRAPAQLPPGAVLVVGAGASGAQIAEELMLAGRQVFLSVSRHRRAPRRYRGHDHIWWWIETGMDQTPAAQQPRNSAPLVHSGVAGGHTIDFRDFAARGMTLLGRLEALEGHQAHFGADLRQNLAEGDAAFHGFMDFVDAHIARKGMALPQDPAARRLAPEPPAVAAAPRRLDLRAAGVTSIIWCTGYRRDYGWLDVPVLDAQGMPLHQAGITAVPGLYFIGLLYLSVMSSSFLFGAGADATRLAAHIAARMQAA